MRPFYYSRPAPEQSAPELIVCAPVRVGSGVQSKAKLQETLRKVARRLALRVAHAAQSTGAETQSPGRNIEPL